MIGSRVGNPINKVFSRSRTIIAEATRNLQKVYEYISRFFPISYEFFRSYYKCPESITNVVWMKSKDAHPVVKKNLGQMHRAVMQYYAIILNIFSFFSTENIHRRRENEKIFSDKRKDYSFIVSLCLLL